MPFFLCRHLQECSLQLLDLISLKLFKEEIIQYRLTVFFVNFLTPFQLQARTHTHTHKNHIFNLYNRNIKTIQIYFF